MIKTINSWRGIFALCIVCFHFAMHEFDQMTFAGVTFFFMLSGFLVTYRSSSLGKQFYSRRLGRIFPLHWLVLIAMIVLNVVFMHKFHYGWDLPLHIALLQSWVPQPAVIYNYSIHAWFLSSLVFCVCLTPLLVKFLNKLSNKARWIVIFSVCAIVILINLIICDDLNDYFYVFPITRLVDYTLGTVLGLTLRDHNNSRQISIARATGIEVVTLIIFAAFIAMHASGNAWAHKLGNSPLWWVPMTLLITSCTFLNGNEGLIGKLLRLKPLLWLGTISFEIYLLQKFANNLYCYVVAPFFGHYKIFIYDYSFVGTLPLLIILAWATHHLMKAITPAITKSRKV